jgi:anti-sigma B factor antagonist
MRNEVCAMEVRQDIRDGRLVLTPDGALLVSGPAEEFEALIQTLLAEGHRHLIVDLEHVAHLDSGGVRALVRGYLTAQRLGGSLALSNTNRHVSRLMALMRLDQVFPMFESVDAAIATAPAGLSQLPTGSAAGPR